MERFVSSMGDSARSSLGEARQLARRISMEDVAWLVFELPASLYDRRATPSLIFENETTIRRIRDYPSSWRELSDEELLALSWSQ